MGPTYRLALYTCQLLTASLCQFLPFPSLRLQNTKPLAVALPRPGCPAVISSRPDPPQKRIKTNETSVVWSNKKILPQLANQILHIKIGSTTVSVMIQESHLRALGFTFLLCCGTASPFAAAQPSSNTDAAAREDDSLDSATMAILVLVVVSALLFLGSFSLWIQRCCDSPVSYTRSETFRSAIFAGGGSTVRRGASESSAAESVRGVDKAAIDSFPTFVYSEVKDLKIGVGSLECAVCLNEFSGEEILKLLPSCDHVFHPVCIATWLTNHTTCPVCRATVAGNRGNPVKMERIPLDTANNSDQDSFSADANSNSPCKPRAEETAGDAKTGMASSVSGESAIQHAGDYERFTLKLPDGVREQIAKAGSRLKRSASCEHLPGVSSRKRGFSDGGDGSGSHVSRWLGRSERWVSSVAPSDCLSVKEEVAGNRSDQLPV